MKCASVLIPVKSPSAAKSRLAPLLDAGQRAGVQLAMLQDMIGGLRRAGRVRSVTLVGPAPAAGLAGRLGLAFLAEGPEPDGLNGAVAGGCRKLALAGAGLILVLPGDLPLLAAGEVDRAMAAAMRGDGAVVSPDRARRGTHGMALGAGPE